MSLQPKPVNNAPVFIAGSALGISGLLGIIFDDQWVTLTLKIIGDETLNNQLVYGLVNVLPAIFIFSGLALMLRARKERPVT